MIEKLYNLSEGTKIALYITALICLLVIGLHLQVDSTEEPLPNSTETNQSLNGSNQTAPGNVTNTSDINNSFVNNSTNLTKSSNTSEPVNESG